MNRQRVLALLFALLCLSGLSTPARTQSASQWHSLAPLEGGTVNALLEKDGVVYAGTATTGIFTSSDNGKKWREANNGLGNLVINALATASGNLLAATNSGIYRSSDGGQNWTLAGLKNQQVFCFAVTSVGVFAGSDFYRTYRSTDNGQSWVERGRIPGATAFSVTALALIGETLLAGTNAGVFRSTNQGQSWTQVTTGLPNAGFVEVATLLVNGIWEAAILTTTASSICRRFTPPMITGKRGQRSARPSAPRSTAQLMMLRASNHWLSMGRR